MKALPRFTLTTAGMVLALAAPLAAQASVSWNFTSGGTNSSSTFGNERVFAAAGGQQVTATAWSDTGCGWNCGSDAEIYDAYLGQWSGGLGVNNRDNESGSPDHSTDNAADFDFILFDFSSATGQTFSMETASVGWTSTGDADLSVLAYLGDNPPPSVGQKTFSGLLSDGWSLVSQINAYGTGAKTVQNPAAITSSWWIVSAYNPAFGGNTTGMDTGDDYLKISALSGFFEETQNGGGGTPGIPEPASILLLGLGLPLMRLLGRTRG